MLTSPDPADKLAPPPGPLTDDRPTLPGTPPDWPARRPDLEIVPGKYAKVPGPDGWPDPEQRRRILHALANHELQATELFALALLRFPDAPAPFRRGLAEIMEDEQRHTRMYVARLEAQGGRLGGYPVSGYFWHKAADLTTPLRFVCAMSLTFENANLDHTLANAELARQCGDDKTAAVIDQVHLDEREHVRFGWRWLRSLKPPGQSMWRTYRDNLVLPLHPGRAAGGKVERASRRAAGLDDDFIDRLAEARGKTGPGGRRLE